MLSKHQFGFGKPKYRASSNTIVDSIRKHMNAGKTTCANFVDLLKLFDTLSNSQIIANRSRCSITVIERELFTDYLLVENSYSGELSPVKSVTCGVPQGSSLDHSYY